MHIPSVYSLIDKAIRDYDMLKPCDRVLVAVSGGKDSTLLAQYMASRAHQARPAFELRAVTVQSGVAPPLSSGIAALFEQWGLPLQRISVDILGQVKTGHKMNCWWCSTRRRGELLRIALEDGFNKIALGHHLDDILSTLLMNTIEKGNFNTMMPNFKYDKYPVRVIRPLALVTEDRIIEYAAEREWTQCTCTCNYQANTTRSEARNALERLTGGNTQKKMMLFRAAMNSAVSRCPILIPPLP